jgi:hypothetical protein
MIIDHPEALDYFFHERNFAEASTP